MWWFAIGRHHHELQMLLFTLMVAVLLQSVSSYDKIFMGHATNKPGYNFVCHQRELFNTLGGQIDSRKEYYESNLKDCSILLTAPSGMLIDFRFTEMNIIASHLNTCFDANLNIYDGSTNTTSLLLGFPNGICGQAIPAFHIRSTSNTMLIKLQITSPYTSSFSAIYTAYSPRTSVLCFYCDDLCLPDKSQQCDGLQNCRDALDETDVCNELPPPVPPSNNEAEEELKLILIFVLGGICIIFFVIIIALLVKKKLTRYCIEKRRRRRAAAAAHLMLQQYPSPMGPRGAGHPAGIPPLNLNPHRPFMAGPTIPSSVRAPTRGIPRSNMPPPYTPQDTANTNRQNSGNHNNGVDSSSNNPAFVDEEERPHISDDDETPIANNTNTVVNYSQRTRNSDPIQTQETSFTEPITLHAALPSIESTSNAESQNAPLSEAEANDPTIAENSNVTDVASPATDVTVPVPNVNNPVTEGTHSTLSASNPRLDVSIPIANVGSTATDDASSVTEPAHPVTDSSVTLTDSSPITDATNSVKDTTNNELDIGVNSSTEVTFDLPENEIFNTPVDVSRRDTIYVIQDLDLESQDVQDSGEVVYI